MKLSSKVYDVLKWVCITVIPALVVFLNTCLPIWGVTPEVTSVVVTSISALGLFMGSILGFSSANYYKEERTND